MQVKFVSVEQQHRKVLTPTVPVANHVKCILRQSKKNEHSQLSIDIYPVKWYENTERILCSVSKV